MSKLLPTLIVAAALLGFPSLSSAQRALAPEPYDAVIAHAVTAFDAGRYLESRALFARAHELRPNARTLRGMGLAAFEAGHYALTVLDLQRALTETRHAMNDAQRTEVQRVLADAEARTARYRLMGQPPGAAIRVDGEAPLWDAAGFLLLDRGTHELELKRTDGEVRRWTVEVHGGPAVDFDLDPPPVDRPPKRVPGQNPWHTEPVAAPPRTVALSVPRTEPRDDAPPVLAFVALGASAAAAGVAIWQWRARESEIEIWNSDRCLQGTRTRRENCAGTEAAFERAELISWISAGAAAACAGLGIALLATGGGDDDDTACFTSGTAFTCRTSF